MNPTYGRDELLGFLEMVQNKGLANTHTAQGMRVAASKVLADVPADEAADVRKIDPSQAIRRFNNRNKGALAPGSLAEYQRRITKAIKEFVRYTDNPSGYKVMGREAAPRAGGTEDQKPKRTPPAGNEDTRGRAAERERELGGLSHSFPLRPEFLAQVYVPKDLKMDEARRLAAFLTALAVDYLPQG